MRIRDAYTKLDRTIAPQGPAAGGNAAAKQAKESAAKPAVSGAATSVNLSSRAQELSASADASSAKVASLKAAISGGTFKVDAQAIASKLVGDDP